MSFLNLQRNRASELEKINAKLKEQNSGGFERDPNFWQPVVDKNGNGIAIIRFMPTPNNEDLPYVRKFSHSFKGPGGWYIEDSLTTIGQKDPVGEANSKLWDTEIEANQEIARKRKRKLGFIANILVVKHAARPEDEGKVFKYQFGKKIFDKLNDKMNPPEELGEAGWNPFDFWAGANFVLRIKKVGDFRNYDDSGFQDRTPLFGAADGEDTADGKLAALYEKLHSLQAEVDPAKFKSYEELERKFLKVIGENRTSEEPAPRARRQETAPTSTARDEEPPFDMNDSGDTGGESEDPASFFKKLAGG